MSKYTCLFCGRLNFVHGRHKCVRCRFCGSHRAVHITIYHILRDQPIRFVDEYLAAQTYTERRNVKKYGERNPVKMEFKIPDRVAKRVYSVCLWCGKIISDRPHGKRKRKFCDLDCWSRWANARQGKDPGGLDKSKVID